MRATVSALNSSVNDLRFRLAIGHLHDHYRGSEGVHEIGAGPTRLARGYVLELQGKIDLAKHDYLEADNLLRDSPNVYLKMSACSFLSVLLARLGNHKAASDRLDSLRSLQRQSDSEPIRMHIPWLEGLLAVAREDLLSAEVNFELAYSHYLRLNQKGYIAILALDIAMVRIQQGKLLTVEKLLGEAADVLKSIGLSTEQRAAKLVLKRLAKGRLSVKALERLRLALGLKLGAPRWPT